MIIARRTAMITKMISDDEVLKSVTIEKIIPDHANGGESLRIPAGEWLF